MDKFFQSVIFIGDNEKLDFFLKNKFFKFNPNSPDNLVINRKTNKKSLGIGELKTLKEFSYLKSYNRKEKFIKIEDGETLTIEAQNSLLKLLEEPPEYTLIVIRCNKQPNFLNTIFSRCAVIDTEEKDKTTENLSDIKTDIKNFLDLELYERIVFINKILSSNDIETKENNINLLFQSVTEKLLFKVERNLDNHDKILKLESHLNKVKEIRKKVKQNVNIKLSLDNLALIDLK